MKTFLKSDLMISLYTILIMILMVTNNIYIIQSAIICSFILLLIFGYGILHDTSGGYGVSIDGVYDLCNDNIYKSCKKRLIILVNNV